jgi:anti-sigma regulatory factor (Ser/Thr protein kinase)
MSSLAKHTFAVPKDHVLEKILEFGSDLADFTGEAEEYVFDFQGKGLETPFGMLYLAFVIRNFMEKHPGAAFVPIQYEERDYAAHMGYFHACGFDLGNLPGQAHGSDTYLPITIMPVSKLKEQARQEFREVGEVIEDHSKKLSVILLQQADDGLVEILTYTFRELIRNIIEHSQSETLAYCAQFRRKAKQAEIAILDTGIGIRAALSNNPNLQIRTDREALNLALMPGISGKFFKGIRKSPYDVWQNSGYGLFAVSRLCGHGGKFTICSGDTTLALKPNQKDYHRSAFQGTALRISLSNADTKNTGAALARIMKEGKALEKEFGATGAEAATASKMLSSEFMNNPGQGKPS